jgi:hypothetical protein
MQHTRFVALLWVLSGMACTGMSIDDAGPTAYPLDDVLRVHHMQVKGTHNSYHVIGEVDSDQWRYDHAPLDEQLATQGVRAFELDVSLDEASGTYRVFHIGLVDEGTNCATLAICLGTLGAWSRAHRGHAPLIVQIEPKDEGSTPDIETYVAGIEAIVDDELGRDLVLTPDMVQGERETLASAIESDGWPTLSVARGRTILFLDGGRAATAYSRGDSDLRDRLMFVRGREGTAIAAISKIDDPIGNEAAIADAARANRLVRTRGDTDGVEARANDKTRWNAALATGAHIVSTDFPAANPYVDYFVDIDDGTPARCNPLTAPEACTSEAIESAALLRF